jgi:hypothetical protein
MLLQKCRFPDEFQQYCSIANKFGSDLSLVGENPPFVSYIPGYKFKTVSFS